MATNFSFPKMTPAQIAEALHSYGIAPAESLRAEDIAKPQPNLLPSVLTLFFASVDGYDPDEQLGFEALQVLDKDNPEFYMDGLGVMRLYQRSRKFLESIHFPGLTLGDFLLPDPCRVVHVLSAIVNYLHFKQEKLALLEPIVEEFAGYDERRAHLKARIAEHQKVIAEHRHKEEMEALVVQQLEAEVNDLKQNIHDYNKQQMALRGKAKAIEEEGEGILSKISQADFELMKQTQENSKLSSKIVQSPEKLQRALEEKRSVRSELKNLEKMAMQKVQEKNNALEMYTKAYEKLSKHSSKISALHEQTTAAKAAEKEVKAHKAKISDQTLEIKTLDSKAAEWQRKVHETGGCLKAKEEERDQRVGDNIRKMASLKSEFESELKCLEDRQKKTEDKIAKAIDLCSQADSVSIAARKKHEEINAKYEQICEEANHYMDDIDRTIEVESRLNT